MAYPYYPPYQNNYYQNNVNSGLIWVQGEAGAKSYIVAPNNTVPLWDTERQTVYLKSCDASGMPSIKIIDYTVRDTTPQNVPIASNVSYATKEDLNAIEKEINDLKAKFHDVGGSNE